MWYIPDMKDGLDLVKRLDPYNENAVNITPCELYMFSVCVCVCVCVLSSVSYSGNPLIRAPMKVSLLVRCPHFRG